MEGWTAEDFLAYNRNILARYKEMPGDTIHIHDLKNGGVRPRLKSEVIAEAEAAIIHWRSKIEVVK